MEGLFLPCRNDAVPLDVDAALGDRIGRLEQRARLVRERDRKILGGLALHGNSLPCSCAPSELRDRFCPLTLPAHARDVKPCPPPSWPCAAPLARSMRASR